MASITYEKFTIFGSGFDQTRNDSGEGQKEPDYHNGNFTSAVIDSTGQYVWLAYGSSNLKKYKIDTWEEQAHSVPFGDVTHPTNSDNNYALSCRINGVTVFDMTDGSIIATMNVPDANMASVPFDSVIDDDVIHVAKINTGRQSYAIQSFDVENQTYSMSSVMYNRSAYGFVDADTLYMLQPAQWQTDRTVIFGVSPSGATQWTDTAPESNPTYGNFINMRGALTGRGKIYAPTLYGGKWVLGEYDGNSVPDFLTPTPSKVIGEFASSPSIMWEYSKFNICYNNGRTKSAFATDIGTFYTDFDTKLVKIENDPNNFKPLAMNDHYIIGQKGTTQVCVLSI